MLDTILTAIFVACFAAALASPLVPGPYRGGFRLNLSSPARFILAMFFGLIGAMLGLHIVARYIPIA